MRKYIVLLMAAMLGFTACHNELERVSFDPSKSTAPVLQEFDVIDGELSVEYTPAELNVNKKLAAHALAIVELNGEKVSKRLDGKKAEGENKIVVNSANLAKALMTLGCEEGSRCSFKVVVRAAATSTVPDSDTAGCIDSEGKAEINDYQIILPSGDPYARYTEKSAWSLIGSFNDWAGDYEMWTNGTLHVAKGVELEAGAEVKFRKDAGWDVNFGYAEGVESYELGVEFNVAQNGGNIKIAEAGKYDFILDPEAGTAKIIESVAAQEDPYAAYTETSPWSLIGSFNDWAGDVEMVTNGTLHVAKKVTFTAGTEFKFRKDASWDVNFGYAEGVESYELDEEFAVAQNGGNIKIAEDGEYDIFLDPEAGTAKIILTQAVEIDPYVAYTEVSPWSVIGSFNSWGGDYEMVTNGTLHVAKAIALNAGEEWKFRKDASWDVNFGYAEGVSSYELDEEFAVAQNGANIVVAEDGVYDFILDPENAVAKVIKSIAKDAGDTPAPAPKPKAWSLIGTLEDSGWDKDYDLTNVSGDVWTIQNVFVREKDEFKIRADHDWAKSYGGPEENAESTYEEGNVYGVYQPTLGESFAAGGKNIRIGVEGNYNITFTYGDEPTILIEEYKEFPEQLYMIGAEFGNWDWNSDGVVEMTPVLHNPDWGANAEGQFYTVRYFTAGQGFKFCAKRAWDGDFWGLTTNDGFTEAGGNCTVETDGFYLVHIDFKAEKVHVEPARVYGIGDAFGGWTEEMESALFVPDGKVLKATVTNGANIRMYVASSIATSGWWTREFNIIDGVIVPRLMDELPGVSALANQVVTLDFNAGTGSITGEGEEPEPPSTDFADYIYAIGADTGWSGVYPLRSGVESGANNGVYKGFGYLSGEFKFKPNEADWDGDWECTGEGQLGQGSDNCPAPAAAGYYMIVVDLNEMTYELTPINTIGIVGPAQAGGWDSDTDMIYNTDGGYWEVSNVTLSAGEMKFRANDAWDINWGGALDALVQGGGNIAVEAGTYDIKFYALCDGKAYATLTAK